MNIHEYRLVAIGWSFLILFLTVFWYATLRRLTVVFKERLDATRSHQSISGMPGMFLFLFRGDFKQTGDERLIAVCGRLRRLLFGYLGCLIAYTIFMVIMRTRI